MKNNIISKISNDGRLCNVLYLKKKNVKLSNFNTSVLHYM